MNENEGTRKGSKEPPTPEEGAEVLTPPSSSPYIVWCEGKGGKSEGKENPAKDHPSAMTNMD